MGEFYGMHIMPQKQLKNIFHMWDREKYCGHATYVITSVTKIAMVEQNNNTENRISVSNPNHLLS